MFTKQKQENRRRLGGVLAGIVFALTLFSVPGRATLLDVPGFQGLRFQKDGTFKIIQLTDLQETGTSSALFRDFLRELARTRKPDLFVITGDLIADAQLKSTSFEAARSTRERIVNSFMNVFDEIFETYGIPVTVVPGDEDNAHPKYASSREVLFGMYARHKSFVGGRTDADYGARCDTGEMYGTHNLLVFNHKGEHVMANLWLFDSGTNYVKTQQISWMRETYKQLSTGWDMEVILEEATEDDPEVTALVPAALPSLAFQHVLPPEVRNVLSEAGETPEHAQGPRQTLRVGDLDRSTDQYLNLSQIGALAIFSGNHPGTAFVVPGDDDGPDFVVSPTAEFHKDASCPKELRGAREIVLDRLDLTTYQTRLVTYRELFLDSNLRASKLWEQRIDFFETHGTGANAWDALWFRPLLWLSSLFVKK